MATIVRVEAAPPSATPCVGRFAPSPTGPLHAGSLVAALASWLHARARGGRWLVRIEDVDTPRCMPGADREILRQLAALGLRPDEPPWWQSQRGAAYAAALESLRARGLAYACRCSRAQIAAELAARGQAPTRHGELVYPGSCRPESRGSAGGPRAHALAASHEPGAQRQAWRLRLPEGEAACVAWTDRRLGAQHQDVARAVGDFVLKRADGLWAYQLAVVVDDAAQGVSDVVRGEDLADNTPRQILLQRALGLPSPRTLHTPLVLSADGEKLSKQHGAAPLAVDEPLAALRDAGSVLGLRVDASGSVADWLAAASRAWHATWIDPKSH